MRTLRRREMLRSCHFHMADLQRVAEYLAAEGLADEPRISIRVGDDRYTGKTLDELFEEAGRPAEPDEVVISISEYGTANLSASIDVDARLNRTDIWVEGREETCVLGLVAGLMTRARAVQVREPSALRFLRRATYVVTVLGSAALFYAIAQGWSDDRRIWWLTGPVMACQVAFYSLVWLSRPTRRTRAILAESAPRRLDPTGNKALVVGVIAAAATIAGVVVAVVAS